MTTIATFNMFTDVGQRSTEIGALTQQIHTLPADKLFHVKVISDGEGRGLIQNRLYQSCIRQVTEQTGDNESVVAGKSKFHLLLPIKRRLAVDDEAITAELDFETALCDLIAASETISGDDMYSAYDRAIRSKNLKVGPFADYLTRFLDVWASKGISFVLKAAERDKALDRSES